MSEWSIVIGAALVVVAVVIVGWVVARRRSMDGVDSFRRQIDALGPQARRTVVDKVQEAAGRDTPSVDDAGNASDAGASAAGDEAPPDEGGARGA